MYSAWHDGDGREKSLPSFLFLMISMSYMFGAVPCAPAPTHPKQSRDILYTPLESFQRVIFHGETMPPLTDLTADTLLSRRDVAEALTRAGYKTAPTTLATLACHGEGPPYVRYGRVPVYRWHDSLTWANGRCSPARKANPERAAHLAA
jgi:hypothetical protein